MQKTLNGARAAVYSDRLVSERLRTGCDATPPCARARVGCFLIGALRISAHGVRLLNWYGEAASAILWRSRILGRHLPEDGAHDVTLLADARKDNALVEPYVTGGNPALRTLPDHYTPGDESEARSAAVDLRPAREGHRASVACLKGQG